MLSILTLCCAVLIANELRSTSVHQTFLALFEPCFHMKQVPHSKHAADYQHPAIDLYICKPRKQQNSQEHFAHEEAYEPTLPSS